MSNEYQMNITFSSKISSEIEANALFFERLWAIDFLKGYELLIHLSLFINTFKSIHTIFSLCEFW